MIIFAKVDLFLSKIVLFLDNYQLRNCCNKENSFTLNLITWFNLQINSKIQPNSVRILSFLVKHWVYQFA